MTKQPKTKLYVIQCNEYYKIGYSKHPIQRLHDMQVGNPYELKLVYSEEVREYKLAESVTHQRLSHKRIRGEWFDCDLAQIMEIIRVTCRQTKIELKDDQLEMVKEGMEPIKARERERIRRKIKKENKKVQLAQYILNSKSDEVKIDKKVLVTMLNGGCGLDRMRAKILGLTYPLDSGWKNRICGKVITKAEYIQCLDRYIRPEIKVNND